MTEPRTWDYPAEPEGVTHVTDATGRTWTRQQSGRWTDNAFTLEWLDLLDRFGPLTEIPTPTLPTEDGALIIASGKGVGAPFENLTLMRVGDYWCGLIPGAVAPTTIARDQITKWVEAAAVPKDKLDALRDELRSVVASADAGLDPNPYIANAARALIDAVDGAS